MTAAIEPAEIDPLAIVNLVMRALVRLRVPVEVRSLESATEDAGRLLRDLGVQAVEAAPRVPTRHLRLVKS